jgi:hypothetical protein
MTTKTETLLKRQQGSQVEKGNVSDLIIPHEAELSRSSDPYDDLTPVKTWRCRICGDVVYLLPGREVEMFFEHLTDCRVARMLRGQGR